MKKLSIILMAFVAFAGLNSCSSEDDVVFTAKPDPEGINFINSFNQTYILTPATAGNVAERFVWNTVDFDVPTNITYELQGSTDADFTSFDILGATGDNNLAVKVSQLMSLAKDAGLDADGETEAPNSGPIYFRVKAYAGEDGGNGLSEMSEIKSLTVVMPEAAVDEEVDLKELYFVGNATPDNWNNNANNIPLFRDPENPDQFYFTGKFVAGEFKLLETLGAWQPQWGLDAGTFTSSDILGGDPGAFPVSADGYYKLTVNTDEQTFTWEPADGASATTYSTVGIIGAATPGGWDADTDLTQSAFNPHIWFINDISLTTEAFKFRANDAWDVNWGIASAALSDKANLGSGDNMTVEEGTYDVWFNDLTGRYILIPQTEATE